VIYGAKILFRGDVINLSHDIQMVGVPDNKRITAVVFQGDTMKLSGKKVLGHRRFDDKFGRNKVYTLKYYEWKPDPKQEEPASLFNSDNTDHIKRMLEIKKQLGL